MRAHPGRNQNRQPVSLPVPVPPAAAGGHPADEPGAGAPGAVSAAHADGRRPGAAVSVPAPGPVPGPGGRSGLPSAAAGGVSLRQLRPVRGPAGAAPADGGGVPPRGGAVPQLSAGGRARVHRPPGHGLQVRGPVEGVRRPAAGPGPV